ncbi:uncharacterized protein SCHCODRAFT_02645517 [Schizophyllum commune H4-8]|uniref:uncharacterized protein n=1 Tax=Schizophyllum commune (strain H4-8 / FGSC 9210) TaxID=578458 RepID=UPI00215FE55E|nr:uncharacterized protein SCHCODRAFT_02645517 [Schizophyllum commune H4-8]KAI5884812.1 hypothetical protein SCHCODRAFT_02645517 [Schizophyllum commune H4-8]
MTKYALTFTAKGALLPLLRPFFLASRSPSSALSPLFPSRRRTPSSFETKYVLLRGGVRPLSFAMAYALLHGDLRPPPPLTRPSALVSPSFPS